MLPRYIMIVDPTDNRTREKPIVCTGETLEELALEFEEKSEFYFLQNILPDGWPYNPVEHAVVFDMEDAGKPMIIEQILKFTDI